MATIIQVEDPKGTYSEIKALIELHYKTISPTGFKYASDSFAGNFPCIYGLFLRLVAHSKEFGLEVGR